MSEKVIPDGFPAAPASRLTGLIEGITEADLEDLRKDITSTKQRLLAMRKLEAIAAAALGKDLLKRSHKSNGKAAADPKPDAATALYEKQKRVALYLQNGARTGHDIITECGVAPSALAQVMLHRWFTKSGNEYRITTSARQELF